MKPRSTLGLAAAIIAVAASAWAYNGGAAAALDGRGPSQPISEGIVTYQAPEMVRVAESEFPTAGVSGLTWVSSEDLTFHPLIPCRVVDTRVIHAPLADQAVYSFNIVATDYSSQGGFSGTCGVPNRALAVQVNVTAVAPPAGGFLTLYPFGALRPNASTLNYSAGQNIANSTTIGRCVMSDGGLCGNDLNVYAYRSAHLLVDVVGYYESPLTVQVDASGSVYGASLGLYLVEHFSPGAYGVHFYRDVSNCVFTATPGWGDALSGSASFVDVEDLVGTPEGVYVTTWASNGSPADRPFQLVVHC